MSGMFTNVLCPLDFDSQSLWAIKIGREALQPGGHLRFLHLRRFPFALTPNEAELPLAESKERLEGILREALGPETPYDTVVESSDDFARSIVEHARNMHADCIVLASHARRGVEKVLLGSIAEQVIRDAPCPVLTIARPAQQNL
jgi:nucleotide-binding universal stress UspA family protein